MPLFCFQRILGLSTGYEDLIRMMLPEVLVDYFDITKSEKKGEVLHLHFTELNSTPKEFASDKLISKGFHQEITIQDFPLRGFQVYLHITRRRWLNETTNQVVSRDWNLVAKGTRLTEEFAAFLKELSRFQR